MICQWRQMMRRPRCVMQCSVMRGRSRVMACAEFQWVGCIVSWPMSSEKSATARGKPSDPGRHVMCSGPDKDQCCCGCWVKTSGCQRQVMVSIWPPKCNFFSCEKLYQDKMLYPVDRIPGFSFNCCLHNLKKLL